MDVTRSGCHDVAQNSIQVFCLEVVFEQMRQGPDVASFEWYRNEAAILAARKDKDIIEKAEIDEAIRRVGF